MLRGRLSRVGIVSFDHFDSQRQTTPDRSLCEVDVVRTTQNAPENPHSVTLVTQTARTPPTARPTVGFGRSLPLRRSPARVRSRDRRDPHCRARANALAGCQKRSAFLSTLLVTRFARSCGAYGVRAGSTGPAPFTPTVGLQVRRTPVHSQRSFTGTPTAPQPHHALPNRLLTAVRRPSHNISVRRSQLTAFGRSHRGDGVDSQLAPTIDFLTNRGATDPRVRPPRLLSCSGNDWVGCHRRHHRIE